MIPVLYLCNTHKNKEVELYWWNYRILDFVKQFNNFQIDKCDCYIIYNHFVLGSKDDKDSGGKDSNNDNKSGDKG